MRVIDEDLTQLDTMLNERLLADGTYEELEVIDIPGQINIKDDVANQAEMENYKSAGAGVTETDGMLSIPANETVSYQLQVTKGGQVPAQVRLHQQRRSGQAQRRAGCICRRRPGGH